MISLNLCHYFSHTKKTFNTDVPNFPHLPVPKGDDDEGGGKKKGKKGKKGGKKKK